MTTSPINTHTHQHTSTINDAKRVGDTITFAVGCGADVRNKAEN